MSKRDYYEVLGVGRGAGDDEIKKAFRRLAHEHHPDKQGGAKESEERFKELNEAYAVLKNPEKRAEYDRFGHVGGARGGGFRGGDAGFGGDFQDLFSDVFYDFFGGGGGRPGGPMPERGNDLKYDLELSFDEAAFGTEKSVKVPRTIGCEECSGTGAKPGTTPLRCSTCGGRGQVSFQQGFLSIARTCVACRGVGTVINDPCTGCRGSGKSRVTNTLQVKVPGGIDTNSRLRLVGEGDFGVNGGPPGDLYIVMNVRPHEIFTREGDDIICELPISFTQAAIGAEVEVPTIEGSVKLKIPHGTQSGKIFRLKNKGIVSLRSGRRGDEQVIIRVETPSKLTARQEEILEEFARISGEDTTPIRKNFFSKVKEIFE
jgi:molecular chaperone DnaJ